MIASATNVGYGCKGGRKDARLAGGLWAASYKPLGICLRRKGTDWTGPEFPMIWASPCAQAGDRDRRFRPVRFPTLAKKERSMDAHERPVVTEENKVAVRAGSTGHHVRYILIASMALVILAWIVVEALVRP